MISQPKNSAPSLSWIPLEANPEVFSQWMQLMGVTEQVVDFVDIFGLDDELLAMVPQPAHAVILLYPVGAGMDERRQQQFPANYLPPGGDIWYLPQTVGNACATVALLHAFANLPNNLRTKLFNENGILAKFIQQAAQLAPVERAKLFESSTDIRNVHHQCADQGQTAAPDADADVDLHFVCLINRQGRLYELDGRQAGGPIEHGPSTPESFLHDCAAVIRRLMNLDPGQVHYTMMALCSTATQ